MGKTFQVFALPTAFAFLSVVGLAQYGPEGSPYHPDKIDGLIEHIHEDLNHGYGVWKLSNGDKDRLNHAGSELRDFAKQWRTGKFDKGKLDDSIGAIQHVLNDNHLSGEDRDALWNDVEQLRRMREAYDKHEIGRW
jgi:hypothetical protein